MRNGPAVNLARIFDAVSCSILGGVAITVVGCATSAPSSGYTPTTGITIPAATVQAGHSCGTCDDQVYKYAVVVSAFAPDAGQSSFVTSSVFDCYVDGFFSNLPAPDGGSATFDVSVFAYNARSFPTALECIPSVAPCPGDDAGTVAEVEGNANWTTSCTVIQIQGVPSQTLCNPLQPTGDAGSSSACDAAFPE